MISDENGFQWFRVLQQRDEATGGECTTYRCAEHSRLLRLVQRPNKDAPFTITYHVEGIAAQHYEGAGEALQAMEANPA